MMPSRRAYWTLFSLLLILSIVGTQLADRHTGARAAFAIPPAAQIAPLRVVELPTLEPRSLPLPAAHYEPSPYHIVGPVRIESGLDGHLFVIDEGDGEVLTELTPEGETVAVHRSGQAPDMKSITDLAILPDRVWIADLLGRSIHVFNRGTGRWKSWEWAIEPYRLEAWAKRHDQILINRIGSPHLFDLMTPDGRILDSFGLLLRDQEYFSLLLDGFIARSRDDIFYIGKYLGVLASFSRTGRINWVAYSIAPPTPPVLMDRDGMKWVHHSPILASLSVAADESRLYVLSRRPEGVLVHSFIDAYSSRTGEYEITFRLPPSERWTSLAIGNDYLYAASDIRIVRWPASLLSHPEPPTLDSQGRTLVPLSPPAHGRRQANQEVVTGVSTGRPGPDQWQ